MKNLGRFSSCTSTWLMDARKLTQQNQRVEEVILQGVPPWPEDLLGLGAAENLADVNHVFGSWNYVICFQSLYSRLNASVSRCYLSLFNCTCHFFFVCPIFLQCVHPSSINHVSVIPCFFKSCSSESMLLSSERPRRSWRRRTRTMTQLNILYFSICIP